jgi:UDP-galactopyranose mutase
LYHGRTVDETSSKGKNFKAVITIVFPLRIAEQSVAQPMLLLAQTLHRFESPSAPASLDHRRRNMGNYIEQHRTHLRAIEPSRRIESSDPPGDLRPDLICFSHLRWDFVYQRPQHLLSRCARERRVFFVEEPVYSSEVPRLDVSRRTDDLWVVVPRLPAGTSESEAAALQQALLIDDLLIEYHISEYVLWYYTPMALGFTRHLEPLAVIYDCMDELSAFKNAPPELKNWEAKLFKRADLVFTGGYSLYESKRECHHNVYPFPSSVDADHFRRARREIADPADQADIPHPRLGFYGAIDERMDLDLIGEIAERRPSWQIILLGPVVKISPSDIPHLPNVHLLGHKPYSSLPDYLSGWDIAIAPFAHNDSTRFISPTKVPEYLAAGKPVISTSIRDVVSPYGQMGLVKIADTPDEFISAAESLLKGHDTVAWLRRVDETLAYESWDRTWARMMKLLNLILRARYPEGAPADARVGDYRSLPHAIAARPVTAK